LEVYHRYEHFLSRKQRTEEIIEKNRTKKSLGELYQSYTEKFEQSLDNVQNPYYGMGNRTKHESEMQALVDKEHQAYQQKYNIDKYNY
jgi:hypothetical protein